MNPYLVKIARQLKDHQERTLAKMDATGGVIADHSMGSEIL